MDKQFAHDCGIDPFAVLAASLCSLGVVVYDRVVSTSGHGCHEEDVTNLVSSAADVPGPLGKATIPVKGSQAGQGHSTVSVELGNLGQVGDDGPSTHLSVALGLLYQIGRPMSCVVVVNERFDGLFDAFVFTLEQPDHALDAGVNQVGRVL